MSNPMGDQMYESGAEIGMQRTPPLVVDENIFPFGPPQSPMMEPPVIEIAGGNANAGKPSTGAVIALAALAFFAFS